MIFACYWSGSPPRYQAAHVDDAHTIAPSSYHLTIYGSALRFAATSVATL